MPQYLLDTNTCIAAMRGHPNVTKRMSTVAPADCLISTVTSYELHTGVEKCTHPAKERVKVELLLRTIAELPFDSDAARESARIRALLESQGQPIGPYAALMAAELADELPVSTAASAAFCQCA